MLAVAGMALLSAVGFAAQPPPVERDPARAARALRVLQAVEAGMPYVPGEVLVRFASELSLEASTGALSVLRAPLASSNARWMGNVLHLSGLAETDAEWAARDLARQPGVLYAQPNYLTYRQFQPDDAGYAEQWNLPLINAPAAWEINRSAAAGVTVAVIDSGLTTADGTFGFSLWTGAGFGIFQVPFARADDFDHARVRPAVDLQVFGGWRTPDGTPLVFDADGHGTHVAGTIAQQTNNGVGFAGLAHGVTLLPIKACFAAWDVRMARSADGIPGFAPAIDGCETTALVDGIRYAADNGANVINLSLGGPSPQPAVLDALRYAVARGVFIVIAAGNEALDGNAVNYPAAYAADIDGVMAVAAVGPARQRAPYSNYGSYVEIAAPGGSGRFGGPADHISQIGPARDDLSLLRLSPAFSRYETFSASGTSMAAPHVAALGALLYSQGVRQPAAIEAAIKRFAADLGPPGRDDDFGYGLIDARATLRGLGIIR